MNTSTSTAKELLAQADRLMRRRDSGAPEELPVLTDLVVEEIEMPSLDFVTDAPAGTSATPSTFAAPAAPAAPVAAERTTGPAPASTFIPNRASPAPALDFVTLDEIIAPAIAPAPAPAPAPTTLMPGHGAAASPHAFAATSATSAATHANVREQFNAQIVTKLEELRHAVFTQAMQQLELHADGGLKLHLRESLTERLAPVVEDVVQAVIEETTQQIRDVVARVVDAEIARLREQLSRKR